MSWLPKRDPISSIVVNGNVIHVDEEGYLVNFAAWDRSVAEELARSDGLMLSAAHWEVIEFLRKYYYDYHVAPAIRILVKVVGKKLGPEKGNSQYLHELFPLGPAKQACRYAGLPKPTGCI